MNAKWIERFIGLAGNVATWSKDPSTRVGAVIVRPDRSIASVGFNGFARRVRDDDRMTDRATKLLFTLHAEINAIIAAKEPLTGYSLFVYPFQPCAQCAAAIIQSGITKVYCPGNPDGEPDRWDDSFSAARSMMREAGITVRWI